MNIIKKIISTFSAMLIVGFVILILVGIYGIMNPTTDSRKRWEGKNPKLRLAVSQLCAPTRFTDLCIETLNKANTSDPKELIKAMIYNSHDALANLHDKADSMLMNNVTDQPVDLDSKRGLVRCKEFLQMAMVDLQKTVDIIEENQLDGLNYYGDEMMAMLNAVITFQKTCVEGFRNINKSREIKEELRGSMEDSRQLGSIALTTINELPYHFSYFGIKEPPPSADQNKSRMSYQNPSPYQISASRFKADDRKLLAPNVWKPTVVVAEDGSGQFKTINEALKAYPEDMGPNLKFSIYVKAGVYYEHIHILPNQTNVYIYGDGNQKTYVFEQPKPRDPSSVKPITVFVTGEGFIAKDIAFGATTDRIMVAFVQADKAIFINCRFDGYRRTLVALAYRQFYFQCIISGTRDFITGDATAVIQESWIIARMPSDPTKIVTNIVTAHARDLRSQTTSFVLIDCQLFPDPSLWKERMRIKTYLGRPLGPFATTVFMENDIGDFIDPEGYLPWDNGTHILYKGFRFYEYNNKGIGASTDKRVKWSPDIKVIGKDEALQFTSGQLLDPRNKWLNPQGIMPLARKHIV